MGRHPQESCRVGQGAAAGSRAAARSRRDRSLPSVARWRHRSWSLS